MVAEELQKVELFYNLKMAEALRKMNELKSELTGIEKVTLIQKYKIFVYFYANFIVCLPSQVAALVENEMKIKTKDEKKKTAVLQV